MLAGLHSCIIRQITGRRARDGVARGPSSREAQRLRERVRSEGRDDREHAIRRISSD